MFQLFQRCLSATLLRRRTVGTRDTSYDGNDAKRLRSMYEKQELPSVPQMRTEVLLRYIAWAML